jgi:hypothetical protein
MNDKTGQKQSDSKLNKKIKTLGEYCMNEQVTSIEALREQFQADEKRLDQIRRHL